MPDNDSMTETTQMAMIGELRKVLKRLRSVGSDVGLCPLVRSLSIELSASGRM